MNSSLKRTISKILFGMAIVAFSATAFAASTSITLRTENVPQSAVPSVAKTLERRFESLATGMFESVESHVEVDKITLRFGGWSPTAKQIEFLTKTPGKFRLILQGERHPMVTQVDIADARPITGGARAELAIRLNDGAAQRVAAFTQGVC